MEVCCHQSLLDLVMDPNSNVRMSGYLEKRGKLKLMGTWKKYWFVLEGQLLLYYKSQLEYINLSACRGSLNIGLASSVKPGQGLTIQVVTRTQSTTLRTKERALQEQWLQALLDSMALPNTLSLKRNSAAPQHFRYSLDNLPAINENEESCAKACEKKTTLPRRVSRGDSMLFRIRKMGGMSYGGVAEGVSASDSSRMKAVEKVMNGKLKSDSSPVREVYKKTSEEVAEENDLSIVSEKEDYPDELDFKGKFQHNLKTIRDLLEQTNRVSGESKDSEQDQDNSSHKEETGGKQRLEENGSKASTEDHDSSTESTERSLTELARTTGITTTAQIHDENQNSDKNLIKKTTSYEDIMKENNYYGRPSKIEATEKVQEQPNSDEDDDDYYSCYDKFALMQNLSVEVEPTLPPRPHHDIYYEVVPPMPDHDIYYEVLPQELSPVQQNGIKHEKKRVFRDKLHQLLKKTPSKEEKEFHNNNEQPKKLKKKRSHSFLKALGFKPKKRERIHSNTCEEESEEEPEYEHVDYNTQFSQQRQVEEEEEGGEEEKEEKYEHLQLLPANALLELKDKLEGKSQNSLQSDEDSDLYEEVVGLSIKELRTSASSLLREDPPVATTSTVPTVEYAQPHKSRQPKSLNIVIPSLPPRRSQRPSSPWHDVPTNNSPVYGSTAGFSLSPKPEDSEAPRTPFFLIQPKESSSRTHAKFPVVPDEILNTPQGFAVIQNQWRKVEQSREWTREQQMVAFPSKAQNKSQETLPKTKVDINGNAEDVHSIDNDSLINKGDSDKLISLNGAHEDSQPDSLEKTTIPDTQCAEDTNSENRLVNDMKESKGEGNVEHNRDSDVELRLPSKTIHYSNTSSPIQQQDKCLEFQLVDFTSNGNLQDLRLRTPGIFSSNQAHNLEIMRINRYSDELHQLLAQLAEITSAPLCHAGATKSLVTPMVAPMQTTLDEELGPIRRRRHSDPDYDIPRPHGSLQLVMQESTPDPSISPDSLEPNMEGKFYLKDLC